MNNDHELKATALNMWANHIETGDVTMSSQDAKNQGKSQQVKNLNTVQFEMVKKLRELSVQELKLSSELITKNGSDNSSGNSARPPRRHF